MTSHADISFDEAFIDRFSYKLNRFKKTGQYSWNFRCPLCGDSKKNERKARGYFFRYEDAMWFKCHNCEQSAPFIGFLKKFDTTLFEEYLYECFADKREARAEKRKKREAQQIAVKKPVFNRKKFESLCVPLKNLPEDHIAVKYVRRRRIPEDADIWYSEKSGELAMLNPDKYTKLIGKDLGPRIIFPAYDEHGNVSHINGRILENREPRYISLRIIDDYESVAYNLNNIDFDKPVYVTEGEIDSLMIDNCISQGHSGLEGILKIPKLTRDNVVFIFDNERRNRDIVKGMQRAITRGCNIFLFPSSIKEKDLNDIICSGVSREDLQKLVVKHTHKGSMAQLHFQSWKDGKYYQ